MPLQWDLRGNLRGVVTFPLPESRSCTTRSAAHAPGAPQTPVPVHVLWDGRLAHTLSSPAPLECTEGLRSAKPPAPTEDRFPMIGVKIHFEISMEVEYFRVCILANSYSAWCAISLEFGACHKQWISKFSRNELSHVAGKHN